MFRLAGCILFILVASTNALAQVGGYDKFVVLLNTGERIEGKNGILRSDTLMGHTLTGKEIAVPISEVKTLYVFEGTKTGLMAVLGGAVGLAIVLNVSLQAEQNQRTVSTEAWIGVTVGGALIGGLIGSQIESWETVRLHTNDF